MKGKLLTTCVASLLLLAGCGSAEPPPDYSSPPDSEKLRVHLPDATTKDKIGGKYDKETGIAIAKNKDTGELFTGWIKEVRGDGAVLMSYYENGIENGPEVTWYGSYEKPAKGNRRGEPIEAGGGTMASGWNLNGKRHGAYRFWGKDGELRLDERYEHGKLVERNGKPVDE